MNAHALQPGDVAVATVRGIPGVRVFLLPNGMSWALDRVVDGGPVGTWRDIADHGTVTDIRRLVVLDLDSAPEEAPDLTPAQHLRALSADGSAPCHLAEWLADQIEAQFPSPQPPEPIDPAARVIDRDGLPWARWRGEWQPLGSGKFAPMEWDTLHDRRGPLAVES